MMVIKQVIEFIAIGFALVLLIMLINGCGKLLVEVTQDEPYKTDPVVVEPIYVIITGNAGVPISIPSGNYFISGNELIIL